MEVRKKPEHGWIEVITGSMFSGKSEELIRRLRRTQIARQKVQIFKPLIDNRFSEDHIVSHSDMRIASQNVRNSDELVKLVADEPPGRVQYLGGSWQARHCGRAGSGLSRPSLRTHASAAGDRRVHHQDPRDLRRLRRPGESHAAPRS